jgi:predicted O-methyltransferase YrrM
MVRERVKRALLRVGRTTLGKHAVHAATAGDRGSGRFADASWPSSAHDFEDLDFLFTSSQLNHGIASLRFDEAALLFRTVRSLGPATIVELGRFKGGSTFLMAVAMAPGSELWSYDLHLEPPPEATGAELDHELQDALERYGLEGVHVVVGDTRTAPPPAQPLDVLFVDADHRYEGARADFARWGALVRLGGHVLFHDAVDNGSWGTTYPGIQRLVAEIERDDRFRRVGGAGTIAHFVRQPDASAQPASSA